MVWETDGEMIRIESVSPEFLEASLTVLLAVLNRSGADSIITAGLGISETHPFLYSSR